MFVYCAKKTNRLEKKDRKGLHSRRTYLAARAGLVVPRILSCFDVFLSLSIRFKGLKKVERETRRGERREIQVHTPPDPSKSLIRSPRLVSCVVGFTVTSDWMAPLLPAPGVASCVANLTLALRLDLIHFFFFNLVNPKVFPLWFS